MKKITLVGVILATVLVLAFIPFRHATAHENTNQKNTISSNQVIYLQSEKDFQSLIAKGLVVVDFYASWCGPCSRLAPIIDQVASGSTVTFVKVDTEKFGSISAKYGIRSIPTVIFFKDSKEVRRETGLKNIGTVIALNAVLDQVFA